MTKIRQRKYLLAIAALVLVFAGCKGESPTSPTTTTSGGTGGVTPPTTASLTVTVSNDSPLVDSTTVVTANVKVGDQPAPNGTAVEFKTTLGTFTDANAPVTVRTTTNGVATATLTSSAAGTATITATVANVAKTAQATFTLKPVTPQPPDTTASITGIAPTIGRPAGGEIITITGKNFVAPVRVLFDYGNGTTPKEAQVVAVSPTQIQVISPAVDLGTGQTKTATIIVINNAGSPTEARITAGTTFTYQADVLTPKITTVSPASGPIDGGTRITIFGEGFQMPVQVFFGSAEATVVNVTFSQIIVMSPTARDTAADASGSVTGPVDIRIVNINSATTVTAANIFRYVAKAQITAMGPTEGLFTGGTRVTIDGTGFNDPVAVVIGGVAAQPIKVTPTQIIAITSGVAPTSCADVPGPTTVTNVDNGDSASGPTFIYRVPKAILLGVTPGAVAAGGTIQVRVANAFGYPRLTVGDTNASITGSTTDAAGITTITGVVPAGLKLDTQACSGVAGATTATPTNFDVTYTSATTGCTDTLKKGLTVNPPATPILTLSPGAASPLTAKFNPAVCTTAGTPPVTTCTSLASITPSAAQTISIVNTGAAPLVIASVTPNGCTNIKVNGPAPNTSVVTCDSAAVSISYNPPAPTPTTATSTGALTSPPLTEQCSVTILTTNAGSKTLQLSGSIQ